MQDGICSGCRESSSTSSWDLLLLQVNSWNWVWVNCLTPKHRKKQRMLQWKWPFIVNLLIKNCDFPVMLLYQSVTHLYLFDSICGFIGTLWLHCLFRFRAAAMDWLGVLPATHSGHPWGTATAQGHGPRLCPYVTWVKVPFGYGCHYGWSFQVWNLYWIM